jgi:hypothetical protein
MKIKKSDIQEPGKSRYRKPQNAVNNNSFNWEKKAKTKGSPKTKWIRTIRAQIIRTNEGVVEGNVVVKQVISTGKLLYQGFEIKRVFDPNSGGNVEKWKKLGFVKQSKNNRIIWNLETSSKSREKKGNSAKSEGNNPTDLF